MDRILQLSLETWRTEYKVRAVKTIIEPIPATLERDPSAIFTVRFHGMDYSAILNVNGATK